MVRPRLPWFLVALLAVAPACTFDPSGPAAIDAADAPTADALDAADHDAPIDAVDAPPIDGAKTLGVHRVLQTVINGAPRSGEVYNYSAHFGPYQVIVTANPLVLPDKPVQKVDTERARTLLAAGVRAIRS